MEFARVVDGVVAEIVRIPAGADLADCIHPDLAAQCVPVEAGTVRPNQVYSEGVFSAPPTLTLEEAKTAARRALVVEINDFIASKPDGGARYDQAWQTGALALKIDYQAALLAGGLSTELETAINDRLALIQSVQNWIYAVRGVLFAKRAEINTAVDLAGVEAVAWDLSLFEVGATGDGANPDPDVYMDQLVIM